METYKAIQAHAFREVPASQRGQTNLYLDSHIYEPGEELGPPFQEIVAKQSSLLVFADYDPLANFAHECAYFLYDPETAKPLGKISAGFPPGPPANLAGFHEPIPTSPNPKVFNVPPILRCPILIPDGERYAVLFSGMSDIRHLNDLEFCYRMLVDRYALRPENIQVLNYDGTLNTRGGKPTTWPGDGTPFRLHVDDRGDRDAFKRALDQLRTQMKREDLLFIHTNNHGVNSGGTSSICQFPGFAPYTANEFCDDLAVLPRFRALIVMMEQCYSGGFNRPLIASSRADHTTIASAAVATRPSYGSIDGNWNCFSRDWIAAHVGYDPYGGPLALNPDGAGCGAISAREAFSYALTVQDRWDTPNFDEDSEEGGDLSLGKRYSLWSIWCAVVLPLLQKHAPDPLDAAYYLKLRGLTLDLQPALIPAIRGFPAELLPELVTRVESIITSALEQG